ncbi:MAG: hypothetical protein K0R00_302 [Herbinix sp.]|jgi:hypothetical protein|nr:hypothetical protein [Herbinix sp.]
MKKISKKIIILLLSMIVFYSISASTTAYAVENAMNITLQVEGTEENLYYRTLSIPYKDRLTLQDALSYIDLNEESLSITGVDIAYITEINGETAGKFGGWDGWLFKVNGFEAIVGIDSTILNDGDTIVIYYGDPYGVGMQYPKADISELKDGILRFTSLDTTYDENNNAIYTVNPVIGASVTWYYDNLSKIYVTDNNGEIKINQEQLTQGKHVIQISKYHNTGIPLILRFPPDNSIIIEDTGMIDIEETNKEFSTISDIGTEIVNKNNVVSSDDENNNLPKTGENGFRSIIIFMVITLGAFSVSCFWKKLNYEK